MPLLRISLVVALALSSSPATAAAPAAQDAFERLKSLAGSWRSTRPGSATVVVYRTIANGSALVESWTMSPTR
ncbi:MAG TPA: hypothetical protein VFS55_08880, partial [Dokdonella sp.]|nr:hypothetical protein [Dokdonella sp.]